MRRLLRLTTFLLLAVWASPANAETYTYEFTGKVFSENGTQDLGGVEWTLQTDAGYFGYNNTKGQQIGSGKKPATAITLSAEGITGNVTSVKIETSGANSTNAQLTVTIGEQTFGNTCSLTNTNTEYEFAGNAAGKIALNYTQTSSKAIYIKRITVEYDNGPAPKPVIEVKGLKALKDVEDSTEVHLYIADGDMARVLFADGEGNAYISDKDTKVFFKEIKTTPALRYNQHIAGYIYGKKTSTGDVTVLEATGKTNSETIVIAEPVTENDIVPTDISVDDCKNHLAGWVAIKETTVNGGKTMADGKTVSINNAHGLGAEQFFQMPYDNAIVDLSAIVFPADGGNCELRPVYNRVEKTTIHDVEEQEFRPVTYVIDENKDFAMPESNIANASVRLKRTFNAGCWNTVTLPFGIENVEGMLRRYKGAEGNVMIFEEAQSIEAGVPYLYKPTEDMENPAYKDVTLTNAAAQDIEYGGFHFVGIYSPHELKTDKTERLLGQDNNLYWPAEGETNKIPGISAYFIVPATVTDARIDTEGGVTVGIGAAQDSTSTGTGEARVYNLNGQYTGRGTKQLPKGIYIMGGRKFVVK